MINNVKYSFVDVKNIYDDEFNQVVIFLKGKHEQKSEDHVEQNFCQYLKRFFRSHISMYFPIHNSYKS